MRGDDPSWYQCLHCKMMVGCAYFSSVKDMIKYAYEVLPSQYRPMLENINIEWMNEHYILNNQNGHQDKSDNDSDSEWEYEDEGEVPPSNRLISKDDELDDQVIYVDYDIEHRYCRENQKNKAYKKWKEEVNKLVSDYLKWSEESEFMFKYTFFVYILLRSGGYKLKDLEKLLEIVDNREWYGIKTPGNETSPKNEFRYIHKLEDEWFGKVSKQDVEAFVKLFSPPGAESSPKRNVLKEYVPKLLPLSDLSAIKSEEFGFLSNSLQNSETVKYPRTKVTGSKEDLMAFKKTFREQYWDRTSGEKSNLEKQDYTITDGKDIEKFWPKLVDLAKKHNVTIDFVKFQISKQIDAGVQGFFKAKENKKTPKAKTPDPPKKGSPKIEQKQRSPSPKKEKTPKRKTPTPSKDTIYSAVCVKGVVKNPITGKFIKTDGKLAKKLRKEGVIL